MLAGEGVERVIPGAGSEEEALEVYRRIYSQTEEERYGVVAFRLSL
jgi:ASC-1-like (ASCH) protein